MAIGKHNNHRASTMLTTCKRVSLIDVVIGKWALGSIGKENEPLGIGPQRPIGVYL